MAYERSPEVQAVIGGLKKESGKKGVLPPNEIRRLCARMRSLFEKDLEPKERAWLWQQSRLMRSFTGAEGDKIEAMYANYCIPRVKLKRTRKD